MNGTLAPLSDGTAAERAALFSAWLKAGDLQMPALYEIAYVHPAGDRMRPNGLGFSGYLNAAAIRQITRGEAP